MMLLFKKNKWNYSWLVSSFIALSYALNVSAAADNCNEHRTELEQKFQIAFSSLNVDQTPKLEFLKTYSPSLSKNALPIELVKNLGFNEKDVIKKVIRTLSLSNKLYSGIRCDTDNEAVAQTLHGQFIRSAAPQVLLLQLQGAYSSEILKGGKLPGDVPDTGGQTVYISEVAKALAATGYKVTIASRGGWNGAQNKNGIEYIKSYPSIRIVYVEDFNSKEFVRKEDFPEVVSYQALSLINLYAVLEKDRPLPQMILSNYWDSGVVGAYIKEYFKKTGTSIPHFWFTHSLGIEKKEANSPSDWPRLRVDERIAFENYILGTIGNNQEDHVVIPTPAHESFLIKQYKINNPEEKMLSFYPGVNLDRFKPATKEQQDEAWEVLIERATFARDNLGKNISSLINYNDLKNNNTLFAIQYSRTEQDKNQLGAINGVYYANKMLKEKGSSKRVVLIIALHNSSLGRGLLSEITKREKEIGRPFVIPFWGGINQSDLPGLISISSFFIQPARNEPWGMTPQEVAACFSGGRNTIILSSDRVNSVVYTFLGPKEKQKTIKYNNSDIIVGNAAIVFTTPKNDCAEKGLLNEQALGFTMAELTIDKEKKSDPILSNLSVAKMSDEAHNVAIGRDWRNLVLDFFPKKDNKDNKSGGNADKDLR